MSASFLAPFLPITYCNSLEKWGPCGTVFEKEANKEKVKTNGNKLTSPVPPPSPRPSSSKCQKDIVAPSPESLPGWVR